MSRACPAPLERVETDQDALLKQPVFVVSGARLSDSLLYILDGGSPTSLRNSASRLKRSRDHSQDETSVRNIAQRIFVSFSGGWFALLAVAFIRSCPGLALPPSKRKPAPLARSGCKF